MGKSLCNHFVHILSVGILSAFTVATVCPSMGEPALKRVAQAVPPPTPSDPAYPSPTLSDPAYPSPTFVQRSVNSYVYIVSDDAVVILEALRQASQTSNPSPEPSPTILATATPMPSPSSTRFFGATIGGPSKPSANASASASPAAAPTKSPSLGTASSDVSGAVLNTISALNSDLQSDLVAQFKRRDIPVVTQNQFDDYCRHGVDSYALHWSVVDPSIRLDHSWELFGYTSSTLEIYWYLTTCNPYQKVLISPTEGASTIYHTSTGTNFQARAPTDLIASIFGILALVHPAGRGLVSIGFTGGISAVSGSLNTLLNNGYGSHDLVALTAQKVAWEVANGYCSGEGHPNCKRVRRP